MTRHVTDPETARRQLRDHEHELQEHGGSYDPTAHDTRPMRVALAGNPNCGKDHPLQRLDRARTSMWATGPE